MLTDVFVEVFGWATTQLIWDPLYQLWLAFENVLNVDLMWLWELLFT